MRSSAGAERRPDQLSKKQRRAAMVAAILVLVAGAAGLVFSALRENIVYFYGPSDVAAARLSQGTRFRLGGLVAEGTIVREASGEVRFSVTDGTASVPVRYRGVLPDLFREGQGVVTEGRLDGSTFLADTVLAKHDERYMPREVVDALKRAGTWRGDAALRAPANP
jgi:cytochrome c-type biogenesis protein CcmE